MAATYGNLGLAYEKQGNKAEAKRYYQKSIELFKQLGSPNAKKAQALLDALQWQLILLTLKNDTFF